MSLWIVIGGQFGSEGKGKVSAHITRSEQIDICVRCGGPNSGHSFIAPDGSRLLLRQLPTGVIRRETRLLIPAGALVDLTVLHGEMTRFGLGPERVGLDRNTMIVESADQSTEQQLDMNGRLGSTLTGVGAAVARRALRVADVRLAGNVEVSWIRNLITDVAEECNAALDRGRKVLVEGTQGFGLSLYHSDFYPKTTSRDTSAAGFLSEVGLSPMRVTDIVAVFRTFPIRVAGGQAGPLKDEISWEILQQESGYSTELREYTTVSHKLRRVARFDWDLARWAADRNRPTKIAIMGLDYLDVGDFDKRNVFELGLKSRSFLLRFEAEVGKPCYLGTGPSLDQICDVRAIGTHERSQDVTFA